MSWSSCRRAFLVLGAPLALAGLAGCSIRPLYGRAEGEMLTSELAAIEVKVRRNRLAQILQVELEDALNPCGAQIEPRYELLLDVNRFRNSLGIQPDSTITRYDLYLLASFILRERGQIEPIYSSAARRVASYNVVREPYSTLVAEQDAERRAAVELSREIRTQLALFLNSRST
jgi:LPS-assembly lipoprotein